MASPPDFFIDFLRNLGLKSTLFCRSHLCAPWGLYQETLDEMVFHYVVDGDCYLWIGSPQAEPVHAKTGDFILLPRGTAHGIASSEGSSLTHTSRICYTAERGHYKFLEGAGKESKFLCGSFTVNPHGAELLLRSLPDLVILTLDDSPQNNWIKSTLQLVEHETYLNTPGREDMLSHLLDVLFVQILRWCVDSKMYADVGLLGAIRDPDLRPAIEAILSDIRQPWQLTELAGISGLSRSAFSERFNRIVGESPMAFIRSERLRRSISLLESDLFSVKEVANQVGFSRVEVFIRSFESAYGCSPNRHRIRSKGYAS